MAKRALISVTDKTKLDVLLEGLNKYNYEIVSTGGTAKELRKIIAEKGYKINVIDVKDITDYPELFDGRVKTLHPAILGGILYDRDNPEHVKQAKKNKIQPIELVVVNLYAFEKAAAKSGINEEELIEEIDIGGPTATMSAIKNWKHVGILADPGSYADIVKEMDANNGQLTDKTRKTLAAFAMNKIADYRNANAVELTRRFTGDETLRQKFVKGNRLGRYGENWHQEAWLFVMPGVNEPNVVKARQVHGIPPGFNNYLDAEAALETVKEFKEPAAVIVKHGNPCGVAVSDNLVNALERAWQGDPVSAFGSVIAFNKKVEIDVIKVICERNNSGGRKGWFVEVMIAPEFSKDALEYVKNLDSKKGLRLLEVSELGEEKERFAYRNLLGGILKQTKDDKMYLADNIDELFRKPFILKCENSGKELTVGTVTEKKPDESMKGLYDFAMKTAKHTKSNAIVIAREYAPGKYQVLGMGAGQPNRKVSCKIAITKAHENLETEYDMLTGDNIGKEILASEYDELMKTKRLDGMDKKSYIKDQLEKYCVLASDSFFPFRDSIDEIAGFGIKNIIQPGGSIKDTNIIEAANQHKIAMIFTGTRHFLH